MEIRTIGIDLGKTIFLFCQILPDDNQRSSRSA
jgi:hypothetical protein